MQTRTSGGGPDPGQLIKQEVENQLGFIQDKVESFFNLFDKVEVEKDGSTTEKKDSGIKDGIVVEKSGEQPDNADRGTGSTVNETVTVDGVPPGELERTQTLYSIFVAPIVELVNPKPTGDSAIVDWGNGPIVVPRLSNGNVGGGYNAKPATKKDSVKFLNK